MIELQEVEKGLIQQAFGGDTLNAAIYMARLGHLFKARIDYVTAVGCDRFSEKMMAFWEKEDVGSSMVLCRKGEKPGLYFIELDDKGERRFSYWRAESAARKCFEYPDGLEILERLGNYAAVYLSGISIAILSPVSRDRLLAQLTLLAAAGSRIFFDYNFRPHLWPSLSYAAEIYDRVLTCCHTIFAGVDELKEIHGLATLEAGHDYLGDAGVAESVIRNGSGPCSIRERGRVFTVAAEKVKNVIDTTAAGDAFSGAYLLARISGCTVEQAAKIAHRLAAYVIAHKGAIAPVEAMPEFTDLLEIA